MKNLAIFIFLSAFSLVLTLQLGDQRHCCKNSSFNLSSETCDNDNRPSVFWYCTDGNFSVDTSTVDPTRFQIDYKGKYVTLGDDVIVRPPNYCITNTTGGFAKEVLLYCPSEIIKSSEDPLDVKALLYVVLMFLYAISCVLFGITALIYIIIPQTQDIEGKCTFNLTLMQCLFNFMVFRILILNHGGPYGEVETPNCNLRYVLYVFPILSSFIWYTVLAYHILCRFRQNFRIDESKLMIRYLIMGYGIPGIIILLSIIHFELFKSPYYTCPSMDAIFLLFYVVIPTIIIELVCVYFFVRLQYQLWNVQPVNSPMHSTSVLKKLKFRLLLNVKLCILSGLPRFLIILSVFLGIIMKSDFLLSKIPIFLIFFMSFEGILTFHMMVIRRKRVYQGLAGYIGCILPKKQSSPESEESDGSEKGNENEINGEI